MNSLRVLLILLGLPGLAFAQECADIADDAERLACYDGRKAAPGPEVTPEPQEAPAQDSAPGDQEPEAGPAPGSIVPADSEEYFGKDEPATQVKEFIEANVVELREVGNITYLRLDNGQTWREVEDSGLRIRAGKSVTITEGVLGSYDLKMEGYNQVIKVRRYR